MMENTNKGDALEHRDATARHLYCVRHAQSETNKTGVRMGPEGQLSEFGYKQAAIVAGRLKHIKLEVLLSSSAVRAYETARVISEKTGLPLELLEEAKERKYPSELLQRSATDPEAKKVMARQRAAWESGDYSRISDEETFIELTARIDILMRTIHARPEKHIGLVTHNLLLKALLGRVIFGDEMTGKDVLRLYDKFTCSNTGITHFEVADDGVWRLVTWNDDAHLG